jgi:polar amino acid transport system ATP-binding protein
MTADTPIVQVRGIHKSFGRLEVLMGVSMDIARGEVVAIIGPSGSGKTTFLRCLNRLEPISAGEITFKGQLLERRVPGQPVFQLTGELLRRLRMDIGIVFQQFNLFPHLSVLDNITLAPINVRKVAKAEAEAKAQTLLAKVGLADKADYLPSQLSGGQQQRVAIARALVNNPAIILADEPTGNLDSKSGAEVMAILQWLNRYRGITVALVTHDPRIAQHTNRVIHLSDGLITKEEMIAEPLMADVGGLGL